MRASRLVHFATKIAASNLCDLNLPYRLTYVVTNRCQAHCKMCNIWQKPLQNELTAAEINEIFTKASFFSWINLAGGELFQRPDIQEIILSIIKNSRKLYLLNFPTNGYQTDEILETVDMILKKTTLPRLILSVSIDGNQGLHDRIRGLNGIWNKALQTFHHLRKRRSNRFSVYLGYTVQSENLGEFDNALKSCNNEIGEVTVDDFHFNLAHASGHYYDNINSEALPKPELAVAEIERIVAQQTKKLFDPVSFIEKKYQQHIRYYLNNGRAKYICQAAAASCFIDPTGIVYPCSVFDQPVGNLRDYDLNFTQLWNAEHRNDTRQQIKNRFCPGCWTPCEAYQTLLSHIFHR